MHHSHVIDHVESLRGSAFFVHTDNGIGPGEISDVTSSEGHHEVYHIHHG